MTETGLTARLLYLLWPLILATVAFAYAQRRRTTIASMIVGFTVLFGLTLLQTVLQWRLQTQIFELADVGSLALWPQISRLTIIAVAVAIGLALGWRLRSRNAVPDPALATAHAYAAAIDASDDFEQALPVLTRLIAADPSCVSQITPALQSLRQRDPHLHDASLDEILLRFGSNQSADEALEVAVALAGEGGREERG